MRHGPSSNNHKHNIKFSKEKSLRLKKLQILEIKNHVDLSWYERNCLLQIYLSKTKVNKFWNIYFSENTRVGWKSGFCMTTMHIPTPISVVIFGKRKKKKVLKHPLHHQTDCVWYFHIPKTKTLLERIYFWITHSYSEQCDNSTKSTFRKWM